MASATQTSRSALGAQRFFSGRTKRDEGLAAADFLLRFREWGVSAQVPAFLTRHMRPVGPSDGVRVEDALADWVGLAPRLNDLGGNRDIFSAGGVAGLPSALSTIKNALSQESAHRSSAVQAGNDIRSAETRKLLAEMPVDRLREATRDRLRVGALTDAGFATVLSVLDHGTRLELYPGIGPTTATRIRGAAHTIWQTTFDEMPARIDVTNPTDLTTEFVRRLAAWDAVRRFKRSAADLDLVEALAGLARSLDPSVSHLAVFAAGGQPLGGLLEDVQRVIGLARTVSRAPSSVAAVNPWDDLMARPADYFAMLSELGFILEDEQKTHGDLPEDIVEAVRALELDTSYLSASLRGYQSFGARFAIVQRRVIIGDEMGLGKTVEALAVLAHLRANGSSHALVVCPAAVVTNWIREVSSKSALRPHRVHGPQRLGAATTWVRDGGVAVTTFETLGSIQEQLSSVIDLGCVVVDEAHYIKNPNALRSQRVARVLESADLAILMTGTPLENRIDEFRNLIAYLRPDLVVDAQELAPRRFRQQVAPAYLRRNQEDVLLELPDLVEVEEYLPMSAEDFASYRQAVAIGNFMAMRQSAMSQGTRSAKVQRLIELVAEAESNRRRVIVFSHFRQVLDQLTQILPGEVFGPLTGSTRPPVRQDMVDQFSAAGHGAVLVSQIEAGGVGLNIQAASVVVICEPQLKPTTEWQAIARAHRMGQLELVQVHRLLSEEGVDQRVTEILARKRRLFDDFARLSETAASAPEAVDVSEAELAREVIAAERERLFTTAQESASTT